MKKIFLLIVILLQVGFLSAQERDNVGHRVGAWNISSHNCFKGLSWKIRKSYYSDNSDLYTNEIEIKNNYGSTITFSYNMSENANETTTKYRKTLNPGQTFNSTYCPNVNLVTFYVTDVCFNNNNCKDGCYAQCDNGSPNQPNCGSTNSSSTINNPNTQSTIASNSLPIQTNKTQANQVINTQPNNTNTDVLNVLEPTMNIVTNSIANSMQNSAILAKENNEKIIATQKEFTENNLTDKEIDSLLANPAPSNYATINIYSHHNAYNEPKWNVIINAKKMPMMDNKNNKLEYRIYSGNKLVIQVHPIAAMGPAYLQTITSRIRKGKSYHFIIKRVGMIGFTLEQIEVEPLDKKGNKEYQNANQNIKSDIDY